MSMLPPHFQVDHRYKIDFPLKGKNVLEYNYVLKAKTYLTAMINGHCKLATETIDIINLYLLTFYFRFPPLSKQDTSDSRDMAQFFFNTILGRQTTVKN